MLKILLVIAVIWAVYFFFIKKDMPLTKERKAEKKKPKVTEDETMVVCITCGTYVSTSEAIVSSGQFYCCSECRDKA